MNSIKYIIYMYVRARRLIYMTSFSKNFCFGAGSVYLALTYINDTRVGQWLSKRLIYNKRI